MIVDDDPTYLGLVREWLKDTYKVVIANSGMQAFKMLSKNKVDLILLDHEMPVTSGPQVLKMLRSEHDTADIPVIFLTGHRDRDSVLQVVDLKPEGYFLKDISKDELLEKLKEYFMRAKV
jgi:CheY-like chemotaxis protein